MIYTPSEHEVAIFDTREEIRALGWACSEMRILKPEDDQVAAAYAIGMRSASALLPPSSEEGYKFSIEGEEAAVVLSVMRDWVALGPPEKKDPTTDGAIAKSYKTVKGIFDQVVELAPQAT